MASAFSAIRSNAANAFAWWIDELASMIPARLRRVVRPPRDRLVLDFSGPDLLIHRRTGQQERLVARFDGHEINDFDADHCRRKLFRRKKMSQVDIALRLSSEDMLAKEVALPAAAERDLAQALGFLIDRETPFSEDEVYYDFRLVRREETKGLIVVDLFVAPRRRVDAALDKADRLGLRPTLIEVDTVSDRRHALIDLHSRDQRAGKIGTLSLRPALLTLSAIALIITVIAIPLARRADTAHSLAADVDRLKKDAEVALTLMADLDALKNAGAFLQERRKRYTPTVATIAELTRLLDDDTWLAQLRLGTDEVRLIGYAPEAAALVGIVDRSPLFKTPRFVSPITKDPKFDLERFQMVFGFEAPNS